MSDSRCYSCPHAWFCFKYPTLFQEHYLWHSIIVCYYCSKVVNNLLFCCLTFFLDKKSNKKIKKRRSFHPPTDINTGWFLIFFVEHYDKLFVFNTYFMAVSFRLRLLAVSSFLRTVLFKHFGFWDSFVLAVEIIINYTLFSACLWDTPRIYALKFFIRNFRKLNPKGIACL